LGSNTQPARSGSPSTKVGSIGPSVASERTIGWTTEVDDVAPGPIPPAPWDVRPS
jgi:hypothetical protein